MLLSFDVVDLFVQSYILLLCRFLVSVEVWRSCLKWCDVPGCVVGNERPKHVVTECFNKLTG
jgi:hypothetical protein